MHPHNESILGNVNTGLGPENTFLYKTPCKQPPIYTYLYKESYLSEFRTEAEKEQVRKNLGIDVFPRFRGLFEINTVYNKLDVVFYLGASYLALKSTIGVPPLAYDNTDIWACLARPVLFEDFTEDLIEALRGRQGDKGDKGDTGERGPKGFNGSIDNFVVLSSLEYDNLIDKDLNTFYFVWDGEESQSPVATFENLILTVSGSLTNGTLEITGTITNNILTL